MIIPIILFELQPDETNMYNTPTSIIDDLGEAKWRTTTLCNRSQPRKSCFILRKKITLATFNRY